MTLLNSNLATKADFAALETATTADITRLNAELLKWMVGALIAQAGLIVVLIKLL